MINGPDNIWLNSTRLDEF